MKSFATFLEKENAHSLNNTRCSCYRKYTSFSLGQTNLLLYTGEQRRLLSDWLFESLVFSLLTARQRVNKDGC